MTDYESISPRENRPSNVESEKTSEPPDVEGIEDAASASPLRPASSSGWPISTAMSEQAGPKESRQPLSHMRRGLIAAAALIGSVTGLYIGLGTSPSAAAAPSVASATGHLASVGEAANAAAGGSPGMVGSVFRLSFNQASVTLTTHAGQEVTVDGVSSTKHQRVASSTSRHATNAGRS